MNVLVVGGAGYIGSHCVRQLQQSGHNPVVLDNLVFGHRKAVSEDIAFYDCDLGDCEAVAKILKDEQIELVMHFAAFAYVGESVTEPRKYYENNFVATLRLLETMLDNGVKKFVFSSTCATFGVPETLPLVEDLPQAPINPYGQTKLDVENCLKAFANAYGLSFAAFRYFNASGAAEDGSIGEDHNPETHLIPLVIDAATGRRDNIKIFGTDYPTPDGTCLRDYVHVDDLARAHIAVFDKLAEPGAEYFYNLGTGTPNSVREIINAVEEVTGLKVPVVEDVRRAGDPPALYADSSKAQEELGWKIKYTNVKDIIATAWKWHQSHPNGFED
ncbi:UDP-glucose 4-epimerase GalE [Coraliomargarita akajimensis]|uniref:UDP-glucose 4-epimerase n=1 Tax=Coraliomargarita akajimensis (strain DSM 45221 / IAM 15411 / JCM 23193 / KCTC 12865 / 04OKA010-24) TaxID=583355 RepID=D5EKB8_CORAD|nr:UDP-glucose 4-epimerase GalE [Coraliomargarita akajimensis]ADE54867.1 UDP-glucose 4-epimerase [Coraliomargarita akajimensis DSM 45221]